MTIPFSQVKPASLKMRVIPRYPATYRAGPGIAIQQASGIVTTSVDFANLVRDDISSVTGLYVAAWDNTSKLFKLVLGNSLVGPQGVPGPATASDFETRTLAAGATIAAAVKYLRTAGYAAAGDGGGALYKKVVSLPAGANGFQSADTAWWQYAESVFNVLAFGADPTGVANSAVAINNAIAAAKPSGGTVYLKAGTYDVTGIGINLTNNSVGLTLQGEGLTATVIKSNGAGTNAVLDMTGASAVTVRDLQVSATSVGGGANYGILLASSTTFPNNVNSFNRVSITGYWKKAGIYIFHSSDSQFDGSQVSNFGVLATAVVYITATNDLAATSSFATMYVGTGQSGDWLFKGFEIHEMAAPTGFSSIPPLFISGFFSPIKFIGGVIAGSVGSANGGTVTFGASPVSSVSFIGMQFYGDNATQSAFAFFAYGNVTGLVVQGGAYLYGTSLFSQATSVIWASLNVTANAAPGGPAKFISPAAGGTALLTRSIIDAQSCALDCGAAGQLSHCVLLQPGAITAGTQVANGSF